MFGHSKYRLLFGLWTRPVLSFAVQVVVLGPLILAPDRGLAGTFDLDLRWTPEAQLRPDSDTPSIFTALQEQLGLRLESRRAPLTVLVIDSIERPTPD